MTPLSCMHAFPCIQAWEGEEFPRDPNRPLCNVVHSKLLLVVDWHCTTTTTPTTATTNNNNNATSSSSSSSSAIPNHHNSPHPSSAPYTSPVPSRGPSPGPGSAPPYPLSLRQLFYTPPVRDHESYVKHLAALQIATAAAAGATNAGGGNSKPDPLDKSQDTSTTTNNNNNNINNNILTRTGTNPSQGDQGQETLRDVALPHYYVTFSLVLFHPLSHFSSLISHLLPSLSLVLRPSGPRWWGCRGWHHAARLSQSVHQPRGAGRKQLVLRPLQEAEQWVCDKLSQSTARHTHIAHQGKHVMT